MALGWKDCEHLISKHNGAFLEIIATLIESKEHR